VLGWSVIGAVTVQRQVLVTEIKGKEKEGVNIEECGQLPAYYGMPKYL
jgi:hypothetical protein